MCTFTLHSSPKVPEVVKIGEDEMGRV